MELKTPFPLQQSFDDNFFHLSGTRLSQANLIFTPTYTNLVNFAFTLNKEWFAITVVPLIVLLLNFYSWLFFYGGVLCGYFFIFYTRAWKGWRRAVWEDHKLMHKVEIRSEGERESYWACRFLAVQHCT